ncbi:DUF805 domain-containing protein [Streptomyces sp. PLK6-54]|uniref:DUF805 domain-containing protein n=1 Tax=Actinacidiphila acidipaludis TaxID=2873382 RepID=A0ABS7Q0A1_9ACTN|nr:DUF805 domain-containing protein [Streptomyces acidipaludis]
MRWYLGAFKKYAVFHGRARRKEYWMYFLFTGLVLVVLLALGTAMQTMVPYLLYVVAVIVPSLSVMVRRMHDMGKSGWLALLGFIPVIGGIVMLAFGCIEGERRPNMYGPDPKQTHTYAPQPPS